MHSLIWEHLLIPQLIDTQLMIDDLSSSSRSLSDANVNLVARRWIEAGKPAKPDWDELLQGIGPQMEQEPHR